MANERAAGGGTVKHMEEFRPVTFAKEREQILSDLFTKSVSVAGLTQDNHQLLFNVRSVENETLTLEFASPSQRTLLAGEEIQLLFGLADGQYLVRTKVDRIEKGRVIAPFGSEVYRLQRRNNFRTPIPPNVKVRFHLLNLNTTTLSRIESAPLDLSAGGVRVRWPSGSSPVPKDGDQVGGILSLPTGKEMELFGTVKAVSTSGFEVQVGIEFQNVSLKDEQALLFVCMQIHRDRTPVSR